MSRRGKIWSIVAIGMLALVVGGPWIYIHLVQGDAPPPLTLGSTSASPGATGTTGSAPAGDDPWAVAGDSVGGNMSAAITLMAKQRSGPKLAAQVLFYPVTDASFDTESYHQFATGYFLRRDAMQWFWDQYTPDEHRRGEITASPLRAGTEQLAALPKALVITAEADVLRDEGEAYANKLRQAGVPVIATRYQGIIHDFVMLNALRSTNAAQAAISQATRYLRDALAANQ